MDAARFRMARSFCPARRSHLPIPLAFAIFLTVQVTGQDTIVSIDTSWPEDDYSMVSLTVQDGARLTIAGGSTVTVSNGITVTGNSMILCEGKNNAAQVGGEWIGSGVFLSAENVTIEEGSTISADGQGYTSEKGPGQGAYHFTRPSGAGHGGRGSNGDAASAGLSYGAIDEPTSLGSGGGHGYYQAGMPGGGAIRIAASSALTVDGSLTAGGAPSVASSGTVGGAGAGGSLWIECGTLAGGGTIAANGGNSLVSDLNAGAGGGGRVSLSMTTNNFTGQITARGGAGKQNAGAGTIYTKLHSDSLGTVVVDNNSLHQQWVTPMEGTAEYHLVVAHAGSAFPRPGATLQSLLVQEGGIISHDPNSTPLDFTVVGDVTIQLGGAVNVDGRGYPNEIGPGAGSYAFTYPSGAGHGGRGSNGNAGSAGMTYGSIHEPLEFGSGGGHAYYQGGMPGGGAVKVQIGGTLTVDGSLTARGSDTVEGNGTYGGAGAGGSIWIICDELLGSGLIAADGGQSNIADHSGGAGGGGRVAIYAGADSFGGQVTALGGEGKQGAGAGTVYRKLNFQTYGTVDIDNNSLTQQWVTPLGDTPQYHLIVSNSGTAFPEPNVSLISLTVRDGGIISHDPNATALDFHVLEDATIQGGGRIDLDGRGYPSETGPGAGTYEFTLPSGAGHGGRGSSGSAGTAGQAYGSISEPTEFGSGGGHAYYQGGMPGGGALKLTVGGTLTVDGTIRANGADTISNSGTHGGAGAGGSLWLICSELRGSGQIVANGGESLNSGNPGGAGGGGRITVWADSEDFAGQVTAYGGSGKQGAGAGTVYRKLSPEAHGQTLVDNNGLTQQWVTPISTPIQTHLVVSNSGMAFPEPGTSLVSLNILSGGVIAHDASAQALDFSVINDATIQYGGRIDLDGRGLPSETGLGAGSYEFTLPSGAGHGGRGSNGNAGAAGQTYGSITQPVDFGSGGGRSYYGAGMPGGGALRLDVGGTLNVEGTITANGRDSANVASTYGGAGSGGSLWLSCATLEGSGLIAANGGRSLNEGHPGGAGGGGRIAVYSDINHFTGQVTAFGGEGKQGAGAGTVYSKQSSEPFGTLRLANDGVFQQWVTPLEPEAVAHLQVADDARAFPVPGLEVRSLVVETSGVLSHDPGGWLDFVVLSDAEIRAGGMLDVSGLGYASESGPGPGAYHFTHGSGAGHGGRGGHGNDGVAGGNPYGSAVQPIDLGSGGGRTFYQPGGSGGGRARLEIYGSLQLDGTIKANGSPGPQGSGTQGGGGAGGSVFLGAGNLSGEGSIQAIGGDGGGGGAGGRIAIYCGGENQFDSSRILVEGGTGHAGDGTRGSLIQGTALFKWVLPTRYLLHDTERLEWSAFGVDRTNTTVWLQAMQGGNTTTIATSLLSNGTFDWDTTTFNNGPVELRAFWEGAEGQAMGDVALAASINNSSDIVYQGGEVIGVVTWPSGRIIVVEQDLHVTEGASLTIPAGAIVKFATGVGVTVSGLLNAPATLSAPIIMTSLRDDQAGGDTNLDGSATLPLPGDWSGIRIDGPGALNFSEHVEMRYLEVTHQGAIAASETWLGDAVHHVVGYVTVLDGATLTIEPGAVVKFDPAADLGIEVHEGGLLQAIGTRAQPITFTSSLDDSVGGDTNGDGDETSPGVGDWRWIHLNGGDAALVHAHILYGGGTASGNWNNTATIRTSAASSLEMTNCIVRHSFFDALFLYGSGSEATLINCIFDDADRGIMNESGTHVTLTNCLINNMRWGVFPHGGTLTITNSIVSNCSDRGFGICCGSPQPTITFCNIWNPDGANFVGVTNVIGTNGNISANPKFKDPSRFDYRLNYISPCIDAADTSAAPTLDIAGAPRYDDPRTANTGASVAELSADIGPYEFVETANSDIDLAVSDVLGPSAATAGESAALSWTITNIGTGTALGPWHDRVWIVPAGDGVPVPAGDVLVGTGIALGPGQSFTAEALILAPGAIPGPYLWRVELNAKRDVFEGQNFENNVSDSESPLLLSVPVLTVEGPPAQRLMSIPGQTYWFQFDAVDGQDILVTLDSSINTGVMELYLGGGRVPTRNDYDARQVEDSAADVSTVAPTSSDGTWFVTAYAKLVTGGPRNVLLQASELGFELTGMIPPVAGNMGHVTFNVRGGGLTAAATFELVGPDKAIHNATFTEIVNPSLARVGFDLFGLTEGAYDLRVLYGDVFTLSHALTIVDGDLPDLWVDIVGRNQVRYRAEETYTVHYGNRANVDSPPALIGFVAPGNWDVTDLSGHPMEILQLGERSLAEFTFSLPRIPANSSHSFPIRVASQDFGNFSLDAWIRTIGIAPPSLALPATDPEVELSAVILAASPGEYVLAELIVDTGTEVFRTNFEIHMAEVTEAAVPSITETPLDGETIRHELILTVPRPDSASKGGIPLWDRISMLWDAGSKVKDKVDKAKKAKDYAETTYNKITQDALTECLRKKGCITPETYGNLKRFANNVIYFKLASEVVGAVDQTGTSAAPIEMITAPIDSGWLNIIWSQRWEFFDCGLTIVDNQTVKKSLVEFCKDHSEPPNPPCCDGDGGGGGYGDDVSHDLESGGGKDPNEKHGPTGDYITSRDPILYTVLFENMAEAPWPAQVVTVIDALDKDAFDLDTFELGEMSFGDYKLTPPQGRSDYVGEVDLRPAKEMVVRIESELDKDSGVLSWIFSSLDPATRNLIEDPVDGFLPPNINPPEGDGRMLFTIAPKADLPSGTVIRNRASIVFDLNDPIITNETVHTLDVIAPQSEIADLPALTTTSPITLAITGSDEPGGSGIAAYEIYVSTDFGPYILYGSTPQDAFLFSEPSGHRYRFYSRARDNAGNREPAPVSPPDADTVLMTPEAIVDHLLGTALFAPTGIGYADRNGDLTIDSADILPLIE